MDRRRRAVAASVLLLATAACEEHTVAIRFEPQVGDRYELRSIVDAEVLRTIDGDRSVERSTSEIHATESIVDVEARHVDVEVTVERDGSAPRTYDVRFDRSGRLSGIDLVEGLPAEALGVELATDLPADITSPPSGPLEPGARWTIDRRITLDAQPRAVRVVGTGRIDSLGVEDGHDVAVSVVELTVPVRSVVDTPDGRVTLVGSQHLRSRTTYALADGTARHESTEIHGEVDLVVEPPPGITAPSVRGSLRYDVRTRTDRYPLG